MAHLRRCLLHQPQLEVQEEVAKKLGYLVDQVVKACKHTRKACSDLMYNIADSRVREARMMRVN